MSRSRLPPEPERRRWVALAVVVAAYVLSFFHRFAPAGIAPDLAASFQTTAATLGILAATFFYVYTIMQVPTGILVDTLGPRRVLFAGGLCLAGGSVLFGMAQSFDAALVGRTLIGLGASVTFIAMLKVIAVWFDERHFATVVGASMLIGNLGSVLAGAPLSWLAQTAGWRDVFVGVGLLSLALGVLAWLFVRDRPAGAGGAVPPTFDRTVILAGILRVVRNRATWPAACVNAGLSGSFFAFGGLWVTPFLTQGMGMTRAVATAHLSLYFAGFALGCLLIGALSDRLRRRKPVILASALVYGATWPVWLAGVALPPAASYALFALMGLVTASFTLTWACAKEVNPPQLSGMSTAVVNTCGFLTGALLQPAVGWIIDRHWDGALVDGLRAYAPDDFRAGLWLIAVAAWLGALAAFFIRETHCRNVWQEDGR
ncbi:MAG: MFS transporter [Sulfuritalea sp.]|nr:MFS transporter [Sulfuritalea sp.]